MQFWIGINNFTNEYDNETSWRYVHWYNANRLAFRYWKMSCVVMVITSEHIEFFTSGQRPRVINSMCHM